MRRREFIAGIGSAAGWPILANGSKAGLLPAPIVPQGLKLHRPLITPTAFRSEYW
jgi:hypothetical protein